MSMDIHYTNTKNQTVCLSEWPIAVTDVTQLYGKSWNIVTKDNRARNRASVLYTYRTTRNFNLDISFYADSIEEYRELMNGFEDVTEYDVAAATPGRLYVGDYYLECFIRDTSPNTWEPFFYTVDDKLTVYSAAPFWIKENTLLCYGIGDGEKESEFLNFNYNFVYNYTQSSGTVSFDITAVTRCDFKMVIYGYAEDPAVYINDHLYQVYVTIEQGEYLTIDTRDSTITLTDSHGNTTNLYGSRNQDSYIFQQIDPGADSILWSGTFDFDLTVYEKRSEPEW